MCSSPRSSRSKSGGSSSRDDQRQIGRPQHARQADLGQQSPTVVILPDQPLLSWDDYANAGGGVGLTTARAFGADAILEEIEASGLRGRGGGGFATGSKWASLRRSGGGRHFVVANGRRSRIVR